jgi:parallel beta helix pectate lyase-like protein
MMMKNARFLLVAALAAITPICEAVEVQRTFVSAASGVDTNPCSRALPCRNFAAAMIQTQTGGEVVVLDSGGYGTFVITKSVSVEAPAGVFAGISVLVGTTYGINVNPGVDGIVILRGLTINGVGGQTGIFVDPLKSLLIERCAINRMSNGGVGAVSGASVVMKDTTIIGCPTGFQAGNGFQLVRALIEHCRIEENGTGVGGVAVRGLDPSRTTVRDSVITGAGGGQGVMISPSDGIAELNAENCLISGFSVGVFASAGPGGTGVLRVSNSTITYNNTGVLSNSASTPTVSRGNNTLQGNTTNGTFTTTVAAD